MEEYVLTFLAALIGAVLGSICSLLTLRFSYKQLYAQVVSNSRMDWINIWRENISKFLACAEVLNKCNCCKCTAMCPSPEQLIKLEKEMHEARGMIVSRLNLEDPNHVLMLHLLNEFDMKGNPKNFTEYKEALFALERKILKPEWERVKKEAD